MPKYNRLAGARQLELGIRADSSRPREADVRAIQAASHATRRKAPRRRRRRSDSMAFARERLAALGVIAAIIFGALGPIVVAEYLRLDVGPIRELFAIGLASLLPVFDRIASFYFGGRR